MIAELALGAVLGALYYGLIRLADAVIHMDTPDEGAEYQ